MATPGGVGALLRREGLYSSHLVAWRRERSQGIQEALTPRKRGRKSQHDPLEEENQKLRRQNARLTEDDGRTRATTKPYYEADDLAALLRARKVTHAALVASSHGGEVALNFTRRYTASVSHLVLIGPAATGLPYSEWFLMLQRAEKQSNKVEDLIAASTRSTYLIAPGLPGTTLRVNACTTFSRRLPKTSRTTICHCQKSQPFRMCRNFGCPR